jgi:Zn-dependent peptidase ImmA (M78 family)
LVSAQAVGKYERDEMMPSSGVLIALAKALGATEEYLLNPAAVDLVAVEFRKKRLTSAKDTAEVQARILSEVERYLEVERILAIQAPEVFARVDRPLVPTLDAAERAAETLRDRWELGDDPIPNLCELLEEKGVKVCALPLPENVSGVQAEVRAVDGQHLPVLVVNSGHPGERQRFTMAHELGHVYLRVAKSLNPEKACHRFASALLVPREMLLREVGQHRMNISVRELFQLKQRFGVSAQAVAYRCRDVGIFGPSLFSQVFRVFNARKWRLHEPLEMDPERPQRFERLCIRALAEGAISESKASELLGKTVRELTESLDRPPDQADDGHPSGL